MKKITKNIVIVFAIIVLSIFLISGCTNSKTDEINNETSIVDDFYVISKISEHVNRYNEMASYYNGVRGYKRTLHL